ncbi:hypothetical protein GCM10009578_095670 [Streptomyces rhizosphaericus]
MDMNRLAQKSQEALQNAQTRAQDYGHTEIDDPVYGARPLRRYISHEVETRIGRALLRGDVQEGTTVKVDGRHGELVVTYERHPEIAGLGKAA